VSAHRTSARTAARRDTPDIILSDRGRTEVQT
jgi:hypothetical protein